MSIMSTTLYSNRISYKCIENIGLMNILTINLLNKWTTQQVGNPQTV